MKYITKDKRYNTYRVQHEVNGKQSGFGTFHSLENAQSWRDEMIKHDWSKEYYKENIFKTQEYENRYIKKFNNRYHVVRQFSDGRTRDFGAFRTLEEARTCRDEAFKNNWKLNYDMEFIKEIDNHYEIIRCVRSKGTVITYNYGSFNDLNVAKERRDKLASLNFPEEYVKSVSEDMRFIQTTTNKKGVKRYNVRRYFGNKRVTLASSSNKDYAKVLRDILEFHDWKLLQPNIYLYNNIYYLITVTGRLTNHIVGVFKDKDDAEDNLLYELEYLDTKGLDGVDTNFKSVDNYFDYYHDV